MKSWLDVCIQQIINNTCYNFLSQKIQVHLYNLFDIKLSLCSKCCMLIQTQKKDGDQIANAPSGVGNGVYCETLLVGMQSTGKHQAFIVKSSSLVCSLGRSRSFHTWLSFELQLGIFYWWWHTLLDCSMWRIWQKQLARHGIRRAGIQLLLSTQLHSIS